MAKLLAAAFFVLCALFSCLVFDKHQKDASSTEPKPVHDMNCIYYRDATRPACTPVNPK
jgi:hypothetical protein